MNWPILLVWTVPCGSGFHLTQLNFKGIVLLICPSVFQIADLQQEHQREMEGLLENVRQLSRELKLQMLIIDNFIPPEYQVN